MIDLEDALKLAVSAATSAGERISNGFQEELTVETKGDPADVLTQVDTDCERIIFEKIRSAYPDHDILSEETATETSDASYQWVIDPLDGTSNFVQRIPHVGVSIALCYEGEPVVGVLHFPMLRTTYSAITGSGTTKNGHPVHVAECSALADATAAGIFSDRVHRGEMVRYPPCRAHRRFGAAITSLGFLCEGCIHATALRCFWWDVAAGKLLIEEAGGMVTLQRDDSEDERGVLTFVASSPGIHDEFCDFVSSEYYPLPTQPHAAV